MKLSVIILNYNVRYILEPCIQSVKDALIDIDAEIIVADNNSEDGSCEMVSQNFPDVTLLANKENLGFAKANNKAVSIAQGEYVLILNPDTIVAEGDFEKILDFADSKVNFGALGVRLIDGAATFLPESKRGVPTPKVSFEKLMGLKSHGSGAYYADNVGEFEVAEVPILVGAYMLMKKSVYVEVGGFDERYFMYGEDIDLSYKILKKGYKNYYYGVSQAIHYKGESTKKSAKALKDFNDAMRIFYKDHFSLNLVYDLLMNLGIKAWYLLKYIQAKDEVIHQDFHKQVLYLGKDSGVIDVLRSRYTDVVFQQHDTKVDLLAKVSDAGVEEVIFDMHFISYGEMISCMTQLKKVESVRAFKLRPKNANYIFGSNDSTSKGNVIKL